MGLPERRRSLSPDAQHRWRLVGFGLLIAFGSMLHIVEQWPQPWSPLYTGVLGVSALAVVWRALALTRLRRGSGKHLRARPTDGSPLDSFALFAVLVAMFPWGAPVLVLASFGCWIALCVMSGVDERIVRTRHGQVRVGSDWAPAPADAVGGPA